MRKPFILLALFAVSTIACTGGAAGDPSDDIGDVVVISHSPGNGDQLNLDDSLDTFNALNNSTLTNPGAVTLVFSNSLNPASVINPDPSDPQRTRNVRLFYFDLGQGPFDPEQPTVSGVNPPGASVIVPAEAVLTTTNVPQDTLIIRPRDVTVSNPTRPGQYSVIVEKGVQGADGDGLKGQGYTFFYRVGADNLGPVVVKAVPAPGARDVAPANEIRITMSETIRASTVNDSSLKVEYQPAGASAPISIPGNWYTDGGNGPGNNVPGVQLDANGNFNTTGVSPRNGFDLVFRPDLGAFPVNVTAEDPNDGLCTLISDPPSKGNRGLPLGQAITVRFETIGIGITDTAGNPVPNGSPNTTFTFFTQPVPDPVFAPGIRGAIYYGDTIGVGVIDVDPIRTPYLVGPNPPRGPDSVVTTGTGPAQTVVRVPVLDLVDITTDTRPWTSFHTFLCSLQTPTIYMGNVYALSGSVGGGQVLVIDTFRMRPFGRFGTSSPGGIGLTAFGVTGMACVSNFSANTVTVFDIGAVDWYGGNTLFRAQASFQAAVTAGNPPVHFILNEADFVSVFPHQRPDQSSPPGPPILGTINVGVSPSVVRVTGLPGSLGTGPVLSSSPIVCILNAGEATADFTELTNLNQAASIDPDLDGVILSSRANDVAWSPMAIGGFIGTPPVERPYFFYISSVGGTVELFASGSVGATPSVQPGSGGSLAPNKILNNVGGLEQPSALQWIPLGNAAASFNGYTHAVLVAETGRNRLQQIGVTSEFPNLFQVINTEHLAGLGPVDMTGDPNAVGYSVPFLPTFTTYYVANAGEGTVLKNNYQGGIISVRIRVPGVLHVASWWSR